MSNPGRLWVSTRAPWEEQKGTWTRRTFVGEWKASQQGCILILKWIFTPVCVGLWDGGVTLASVSCKPGASMMQQITVVTNKRMAYLWKIMTQMAVCNCYCILSFTWSCWQWRSCTCWGSTGRWRRLLNRSSWKEKSCLKGFLSNKDFWPTNWSALFHLDNIWWTIFPSIYVQLTMLQCYPGRWLPPL